jgi:hypothetical protein
LNYFTADFRNELVENGIRFPKYDYLHD